MIRPARESFPLAVPLLFAAFVLVLSACGGEEASKPAPAASKAAPAEAPAVRAQTRATPDDLPNALVMALASFGVQEGGGAPVPLPARLEFLVRRNGAWEMASLDDAESNVFHKALAYPMPNGEERLLSVSGSAAIVKLWQPTDSGLQASTIWEKDFGGKFSRMRDVEVADIYGDGANTLVVATHDQGVVATLRPNAAGAFEVSELDQQPNIFVHEIEIGDLDGDGQLEVYATPSEPNRLDGTPQPSAARARPRRCAQGRERPPRRAPGRAPLRALFHFGGPWRKCTAQGGRRECLKGRVLEQTPTQGIRAPRTTTRSRASLLDDLISRRGRHRPRG